MQVKLAESQAKSARTAVFSTETRSGRSAVSPPTPSPPFATHTPGFGPQRSKSHLTATPRHRADMTTLTMPRLITPEQLADYLGQSLRTLEGWRKRGDGPRYVELPKGVRYREDHIVEWLDAKSRGTAA